MLRYKLLSDAGKFNLINNPCIGMKPDIIVSKKFNKDPVVDKVILNSVELSGDSRIQYLSVDYCVLKNMKICEDYYFVNDSTELGKLKEIIPCLKITKAINYIMTSYFPEIILKDEYTAKATEILYWLIDWYIIEWMMAESKKLNTLAMDSFDKLSYLHSSFALVKRLKESYDWSYKIYECRTISNEDGETFRRIDEFLSDFSSKED